MTDENMQVGIRATGLRSYDRESVISCLDPKLITSSTPVSRPGTPKCWVTKTPQTADEVTQQSTVIKNKITKHQKKKYVYGKEYLA
jgi:hypothetical protein